MYIEQPGEFRGTPNSKAEGNPEPSLRNKEGASTIPKGSTLKRVEAPGIQNG
uniref:Uncharacterized protein n=1 Tax=viral metagenome TaxID=1070528 RepID=A0A6M3XLV8_9ZZZZ